MKGKERKIPFSYCNAADNLILLFLIILLIKSISHLKMCDGGKMGAENTPKI